MPTSAITGEGIPDILWNIIKYTQTDMEEKIKIQAGTFQAKVMEVKVIEGLGSTVDVILIQGTISEGDTIVTAGLNGPIVANIRALLTPQPLKELRVKGEYVHHKQIHAS